MSAELEAARPNFLELIEKVVSNPDISVEKMQALLDMQLQMEDRRAAAEFDAAMIRAQKEIEALNWDKKGDNNRYVSYPKIEKMLRPVREKHGFTQSYDSEISPVPGQMIFCCDVSHEAGHTKRYRLPMSIDGQGAKGGGVMTGAQAVGNGTSYAMRYLDKMIWNIPMLVDKDDNDGGEPQKLVTAKQVSELKQLAKDTNTDIKKFCEHFKVESIEKLPTSKYADAVAAFNKKRARITETQAADLQALAEEVKADVPKFCSQFGVKNIANIPASKHADALAAMQKLRA